MRCRNSKTSYDWVLVRVSITVTVKVRVTIRVRVEFGHSELVSTLRIRTAALLRYLSGCNMCYAIRYDTVDNVRSEAERDGQLNVAHGTEMEK